MAEKKFEKPVDLTEQIETSELEEPEFHNFGRYDGFEISFDADKKLAQKLHEKLQPKHGEKLTVETSCVCDGTLLFLDKLIQSLEKRGATNIKIRSEELENPNSKLMDTRFIATGIIWNTNNFKKMHRVPMKRRNK